MKCINDYIAISFSYMTCHFFIPSPHSHSIFQPHRIKLTTFIHRKMNRFPHYNYPDFYSPPPRVIGRVLVHPQPYSGSRFPHHHHPPPSPYSRGGSSPEREIYVPNGDPSLFPQPPRRPDPIYSACGFERPSHHVNLPYSSTAFEQPQPGASTRVGPYYQPPPPPQHQFNHHYNYQGYGGSAPPQGPRPQQQNWRGWQIPASPPPPVGNQGMEDL